MILISRIKKTRTKKNGFTLIEVLVVVAIIALVMSVAVPGANMALKISISNSSRELATTIKSSYDEAVLKGTVYRVAFDIEKSQYWVERGERDFLMTRPENEEAELRRIEKLSEEEKKKLKSPFSMAKTIMKNKKSLPNGVKFQDIINARTHDPQTAGIVYAHVFPHGFVEKLIIHLKDRHDRQHTLIVNSVTGKSALFERYVNDDG